MTQALRLGGRRRLGPMLLALSCGLLFAAGEAGAVLGETADSVAADQLHFKGERRQSMAGRMTAHEISLPDGSSIKEYVNAAGVVFAVSWRTRLKPDLERLLGPNFVLYTGKQSAASGVAGSKMLRSLRQPDLVLHQGGRMNAFAGLAYVPTLVPEGFDADTLR